MSDKLYLGSVHLKASHGRILDALFARLAKAKATQRKQALLRAMTCGELLRKLDLDQAVRYVCLDLIEEPSDGADVDLDIIKKKLADHIYESLGLRAPTLQAEHLAVQPVPVQRPETETLAVEKQEYALPSMASQAQPVAPVTTVANQVNAPQPSGAGTPNSAGVAIKNSQKSPISSLMKMT